MPAESDAAARQAERDRERLRQMQSRHGQLIVVGAAEAPFTVEGDRDSAEVLAGIDALLHFAASKR